MAMTANEIASKYTMCDLTKMLNGAVEEISRLNDLLSIEVLNEGFKLTCKQTKQGLTEFTTMVIEAIRIKEK